MGANCKKAAVAYGVVTTMVGFCFGFFGFSFGGFSFVVHLQFSALPLSEGHCAWWWKRLFLLADACVNVHPSIQCRFGFCFVSASSTISFD